MQMFIELRNDKSSLFESVGRAGGGGGECAFDCESGLCELKEKKKERKKNTSYHRKLMCWAGGGKGHVPVILKCAVIWPSHCEPGSII